MNSRLIGLTCFLNQISKSTGKIVDACGIQKTSELCTEAQLIYNTIGMLTIDGKPRSLGGCFFQLVKTKGDLSELQKKEVR